MVSNKHSCNNPFILFYTMICSLLLFALEKVANVISYCFLMGLNGGLKECTNVLDDKRSISLELSIQK